MTLSLSCVRYKPTIQMNIIRSMNLLLALKISAMSCTCLKIKLLYLRTLQKHTKIIFYFLFEFSKIIPSLIEVLQIYTCTHELALKVDFLSNKVCILYKKFNRNKNNTEVLILQCIIITILYLYVNYTLMMNN